jgi:twitching motility protein PilU
VNFLQALKLMVDHNASDLYLTVDLPPMYRIEGVTRPAGSQPLRQQHLEAVVAGVLSEQQRAEFEASLEMNLAVSQPELGRFRVNVFRQRGAPGVVVRRIRGDILTIDQLGLPPQLKEIMQAKRGLILVVGGTGSGKSTSLAAMIDHWNSSYPGHIITIEDPIEFVHPHKKSVVTQREVGMDTHSFAAALKNTLRQAPDVILIGEIRDTETMDAAITFAETGHLCLGTLHANNANQALERVLNFFPPERHAQILLQLGLNLRAMVSQRLVPAVDGRRAVAVEILRNTPRVADLIHKGEIGLLKTAMHEGVPDGMQTFDHALLVLFRQGRIGYEHALAHADSANDLRLQIKVEGLDRQRMPDQDAGFELELKE